MLCTFLISEKGGCNNYILFKVFTAKSVFLIDAPRFEKKKKGHSKLLQQRCNLRHTALDRHTLDAWLGWLCETCNPLRDRHAAKKGRRVTHKSSLCEDERDRLVS
jgi:hypothetical protein